MNAEQITQIVERLTANFERDLRSVKQTVEELNKSTVAIEYIDQTYDVTVACDLSLEVIKSIPEFEGSTSRYVAWRQAVLNAIKPFLDYRNSLKLYQAICMIRNKITKSADNLLASHGTPLNIDAIIARLDFAYSDKRPIHVIEQEMSILRQGKDSIITFYNKVNQKLTLLTNKNIMTYGDGSNETRIHNVRARENALRVFITGLNAPLSNIIFSLNPPDLPTALARTQELIANQERYNFAMSYESRNPLYNNYSNQNNVRPFYNSVVRQPQFQSQFQQPFQQSFQKPVQSPFQQQNYPPVEPMDVDPSLSKLRQVTQFQNNRNNTFSNFRQNNAGYTQKNYNNNESNNINNQYRRDNYNQRQNYNKQNIQGYKRQGSENNQIQNKIQKINHIEEESVHFLD